MLLSLGSTVYDIENTNLQRTGVPFTSFHRPFIISSKIQKVRPPTNHQSPTKFPPSGKPTITLVGSTSDPTATGSSSIFDVFGFSILTLRYHVCIRKYSESN